MVSRLRSANVTIVWLALAFAASLPWNAQARGWSGGGGVRIAPAPRAFAPRTTFLGARPLPRGRQFQTPRSQIYSGTIVPPIGVPFVVAEPLPIVVPVEPQIWLRDGDKWRLETAAASSARVWQLDATGHWHPDAETR